MTTTDITRAAARRTTRRIAWVAFPGINLFVNPAVRPLAPADRLFPSRSDPVPMPRTAEAIVAGNRSGPP
jgi:hypothetical protein